MPSSPSRLAAERADGGALPAVGAEVVQDGAAEVPGAEDDECGHPRMLAGGVLSPACGP